MRCYHEHVFDEITQMIKDNLEVMYNYNEDALINIRKYCYERDHKRYQPLDYNTLIYFTEEAIAEIINCSFLYDFRDIE
ncbi:MAG: hypothetical protein NC087_10105 [Anaeroplasma bactoclasticum]|nr:hypothetical protein [Anaeroplasma bactoclasticum]